MDETFSLVQVLLWTAGGVFAGAIFGWQLRIMYDTRRLAKKAIEKIEEAEELIVHPVQKPWDGKDRRGSQSGEARLGGTLVVLLLVLAGLSSVWGFVVADRAQDSAKCYTLVNQEYAAVLEIRAVEAGDLDRQAETLDREALDILIVTISSNIDERVASGETTDVRPAFRQYREARAAADALRAKADGIRTDNPYPDASRCEET